MTLPPDHLIARDLAAAAGERLLRLRAEAAAAASGAAASGVAAAADRLRKAGDLGSHEFLAAELARLRPGDAVLSEEAADDPARLKADRVWIIDPLDGTREFGEPGRTDWAVHVALWECGANGGASGDGALTAGAVALPAQGKVLSTAEPPVRAAPGSQKGRSSDTSHAQVLLGPEGGGLRIVVSRTRAPAFTGPLAEMLGAELVPLGSAGAKAAAVITGEADAYVHDGGQYEWDSAAPVAVALAAGLHASRIDGSPLYYNREQPRLPDILICPLPLASLLLSAIGAIRT